ncbi:MAG: alpha/beta fold hydrolase [Clostridia bacterium]|nr:alpha/beta fold hydrolase [Clostridia bacterium]
MKTGLKRFISAVLAFSMLLPLTLCASAEEAENQEEQTVYEHEMPELKEYGFVDSDGVKIEYGIYGDLDAEPLVLLPCNGNGMHSFDGNVLPELAKHFKVIDISPRGCGNSDRGEGKLTFEVESEDLVNVLDYLNIDKAHIFGFSDGANLGFVFTVAHPERVLSLVAMSANINMWGTNPWDEIEIIFKYIAYSIKAFFTKDPADELKRDIEGMMVCQPNLTFCDLKKINVPVLNIYGEHDMIMRWHSKLITKFSGAQELMVIGGGHSTCFRYTDTILLPRILEFYDSI